MIFSNKHNHGLNLHGLTFRFEIAPFVHWRFIHNGDAETNTLGGWRVHFLNHMQKMGPKLAIFLSFFDKNYSNNIKTFINFEKKLKIFYRSSYRGIWWKIYIISRPLISSTKFLYRASMEKFQLFFEIYKSFDIIGVTFVKNKRQKNGQFGSRFLHVIQKMNLPASQSIGFSIPIVYETPVNKWCNFKAECQAVITLYTKTFGGKKFRRNCSPKFFPPKCLKIAPKYFPLNFFPPKS